MSNYTIKFIDGSKLSITEQEFQKLEGRSGLVYIPSCKETINMASISRIYPSENESKMIDRTKQIEAFLHDGTRVIKQFGKWYCADGSRNENGMLEVEPNSDYYPELNIGILPTPEEYQNKYKLLPPKEWIPALMATSSAKSQTPQLETKSQKFLN